MEETTNTKKKSLEEAAREIDDKIAGLEDSLAKAEKSIQTAKDRVRKIRSEIETFKKRKSALFGNMILERGISTFSQMKELLAQLPEKVKDEKKEDTENTEAVSTYSDSPATSTAWREGNY